ncbi:Lectin receptor kinase [Melia azedarach]|uniref:Lectin receptor kinase n=1 Tax=Melia azedarach TaxID=155640 RepID=A0ACC1XHB2_MELAZ|nr:Lectin receptor kinase [Melia azedarach]
MILLLVLSIFLHQASSSPLSFSFSSFNKDSCSIGSLICTGSVTANYGYLSLTSDPLPGNSSSSSPSLPLNRIGRVLYNRPVLAWPATISTTFTIRISPYQNSPGSADGLTFIFAPDSKPSPYYSYGSYLGIVDKFVSGGNVSQLAVEFDTYQNDFDIDGNHVGIDTISTMETVAAVSLNRIGIDLKSGRMIKVQIDYDGWTEMLYVSLGYFGYPLQRVLEKSIILPETVPSSVYVGFTAATGSLSESHQVLDWSFTTIPLPSSSLKNRKLIKP